MPRQQSAELVKQYGIVWSTDELREGLRSLGLHGPLRGRAEQVHRQKGVAACCAISTVIPQRRSDLRLFFRRYPQLPNEPALLLAQDRACKMCHKILQQRFQFRTG